MPLSTTRFDIQQHLETPQDRAAYVAAAFEDGDAELIIQVLSDVARAQGMTAVAREAGITREGLYKALGDGGDPRLSTVLGVIRALGMQLSIVSPSHPDPK